MSRRSRYSSMETRIARDDKRGIEDRWAYGHAVLDDPAKISATGKSLKHGAAEALIADADAVGRKLTEREIQYRLQCARAYKTINEIRTAAFGFESWTDLRDAGFPTVEVDESKPELVEPDDVDATEAFEQLTLLPGFKPTLKVHGQELALGDATVGDLVAYRDKFRHMHEGFGKTLDQIEATVDAILEVTDNMDANAVEAYLTATEADEDGAA